jgi:acyl-CoA thioesterase FadM
MLETVVPIRADDLDRRGFVSSAAHLTYLEELFADGLDEVLGQNWVTVRVELERGVDLVQDDGEVRAEAWLERTGRSNLSFRVALRRGDGTVAVSGRVVLVAWDPQTRRSRLLDPGEVDRLRAAAAPAG